LFLSSCFFRLSSPNPPTTFKMVFNHQPPSVNYKPQSTNFQKKQYLATINPSQCSKN
jgi:hypothetical protein